MGRDPFPNSTAEAGGTYTPAQAPDSTNGQRHDAPDWATQRTNNDAEPPDGAECMLPVTQPLPLIDSDSSGEATSEAAASDSEDDPDVANDARADQKAIAQLNKSKTRMGLRSHALRGVVFPALSGAGPRA